MKQDLLTQFEKEFNILREQFSLTSTLDDFDQIFFFRDFILKEGHIPPSLSRALAHRMVNTYQSWINYLHNLISPNPGNIFTIKENHFFSELEHKKISQLMFQIMALVSTNSYVGLSKDKNKEAEFFYESINFWQKTFLPEMLKITKKINECWNKVSNEEKSKEENKTKRNPLFG
jgi:hypothetical protein